jgi:ABC-type uncharacterized transport system permease subunit
MIYAIISATLAADQLISGISLFFLNLCPIFVSSFESFGKRYENENFWSVVKVVLRTGCAT